MIFSANQKSFLGIDIGSASIKVVELNNVNHVPEFVTYGLSELPLGSSFGENEAAISDLAAAITTTCQKAGTTSKWATAALPTHSVFSSILSLPKMSKTELQSAVSWEAKKVIPLPLDDMVLDSQVIGELG